MIKKMNVGKSVELFNDSQKIDNCLMIAYDENYSCSAIPNLYIWDRIPQGTIIAHFDEAIIQYSNNSHPTLLFYTNDKQENVQWLLDLVDNCKYIKDYIFYCKED